MYFPRVGLNPGLLLCVARITIYCVLQSSKVASRYNANVLHRQLRCKMQSLALDVQRAEYFNKKGICVLMPEVMTPDYTTLLQNTFPFLISFLILPQIDLNGKPLLCAEVNMLIFIASFSGFLKTSNQKGNFGLLDVIAALHWVRENGEAFEIGRASCRERV